MGVSVLIYWSSNAGVSSAQAILWGNTRIGRHFPNSVRGRRRREYVGFQHAINHSANAQVCTKNSAIQFIDDQSSEIHGQVWWQRKCCRCNEPLPRRMMESEWSGKVLTSIELFFGLLTCSNTHGWPKFNLAPLFEINDALDHAILAQWTARCFSCAAFFHLFQFFALFWLWVAFFLYSFVTKLMNKSDVRLVNGVASSLARNRWVLTRFLRDTGHV